MQADLIWGLCLASTISLPAWRLRALDASGAWSAIAMGTIVFGLGGIAPSAALIAFFVSGSILSALPGKLKMPTGDESHGRSWKQVVANGIIPTIAVTIGRVWLTMNLTMTTVAIGAIAAGAADSWATEVGTRYGGVTYDIVTRKPVQPGESGGVTIAGLLTSLAGAIFIASTLWVSPSSGTLSNFFAVVIGGLAGAIGDSIIGSTLQARFICPTCNCYIEQPEHCNGSAVLVKGKGWIKNNVVNFAASAIGAIFSLLVLDFVS
jgi:uncharacterized protein (TIGR00297 family)